MIKGLSEYEKYKVIRPIIGECEYDQFSIPIIKKIEQEKINWEKLVPIGVQNLSPHHNTKNSIVLMFLDDKKLLSLWNNPLKKIPLFNGCAVITTPDFSIYSTMNINDIRHNVYKNRWLGVTWQNLGCNVIPTVCWGDTYTYDLCFSSIEKGSPVIVSTLGCQNNKSIFLEGFNEMKRRIEPPLIIVYGNMIEGMTGKFLNFRYKDCFVKKYTQLRFDEISPIFERKEVV